MKKYIDNKNRKEFKGYETHIIAASILFISIIIVFGNLGIAFFDYVTNPVNKYLGFLAKPTFVVIGYFAFMHLILMKINSNVIQKLLPVGVIAFSFTIMLGEMGDISGELGTYLSTFFKNIIGFYFIWQFLAFVLFLGGVSLFIFQDFLIIYKWIIHTIRNWRDPQPFNLSFHLKQTYKKRSGNLAVKKLSPGNKKLLKREVKFKSNDGLDLVEKSSSSLSSTGTFSNQRYILPKIDEILNHVSDDENHKLNVEYAKERGEKLLATLKTYNVNVALEDTKIGPSVISFELSLSTGTKVGKITSLKNDIKLALATKSVRIQAPIPGKAAIGIEIPTKFLSIVDFKNVIEPLHKKFYDEPLLVGLGKSVNGEVKASFLDKNPHLLIAGATGSGKSICVRTIICSLLLRNSPDEVKMLLIDPKMVEFSIFKEIPHLVAPIITNAKKATACLKQVVLEMEKRFTLLASKRVKNIAEYNKVVSKKEKMPYFIVVIDELADLMVSTAREVEESIMRITQKARASGIHMIIATQRPSTDVLTGVIKSNIPTRIAFAVSSSIDSRTILDSIGAEALLGKGDMLYSSVSSNHLERIQGILVSDDEVYKLVEFTKKQRKPQYYDEYLNIEKAKLHQLNSNNSKQDDLYEVVKDFVILNQKASSSLFQRKFSIGYGRAAKLLDMLEEEGVIGPSKGTKPREVYVSRK